jgi:ribosomal protein S17
MSDDSTTTERANRKVREGLVIGDKMDKTIIVEVEDRVKHALYGMFCAGRASSMCTTSRTRAASATGSP